MLRLLPLALLVVTFSTARAEQIMLEDFDTMTADQFATRVKVDGANLKAELVKTDERVGVNSLKVTAEIDPAKPEWTNVSVHFARAVQNPETLVFWYRGDKATGMYLTLHDSQNQVTDATIGAGLPLNTWTQISLPLKDMHVPNAQPPNDHATLADITEIRIHPYGKMYPEAGTYSFLFDDFAVTTGGLGANAPLAAMLQSIKNGDFEELSADGKGFAQWNFGVSRNAKATLAVSTDVKHSGKYAALLHDESGLSPNVYSRTSQTVPVQPGTAYVLSAWVKGEKVGEGSHVTDWKSYTLNIPGGTYPWTQIKTTFVTKPDQTTVDIGINIVNITDKLWVDDIELKTDLTPLTGLPAGCTALMWIPLKVLGDDQDVPVKLLWEGLPQGAQARLEYEQPSRVQPVIAKLTGAKGSAQMFIAAAQVVRDTHALRIVLTDAAGKEIGQGRREFVIFNRAGIEAVLRPAEKKLTQLQALMASLGRSGQPLDYPRVSETVATNFIPWIREDLDKHELQRAARECDELHVVLDRAISQCKEAQAGLKLAAAPRYQTSDIDIRDGVFVGDVKMPDGQVVRRPVYFTGYGHFNQVKTDMEKWPAYGMNIIQIEFGPNSVITGPDTVQVQAVEDFKAVLDRAERANVSVCLLLSPHYFPGWALEKWPDIGGANGGFNSFDIDNPHARDVEEKFLRTVIPMLKGRKGLHSYCLSNEPIYINGAKSQYNREKWIAYLKRVHGDLAAVAKAHRAEYKTWDDVPTPTGDVVRETPLFYDWVKFNDERFSGWHKWMADIIHEADPAAKVHAKIMMLSFDRNTVGWGNDPEQFCALSQIAGNDSSKGYSAGGEWANGWQAQNMYFDLLNSMKRQPVYNSEDHVIWDRDEEPVPGVHLYNVTWQAAMHGQGASTVWVWERTYDHRADFWGSIMERPDCADMRGRAGLDLMRLAPQVAAFQTQQARVAILYSRASIVYNPAYIDQVNRVYQALNFMGEKIDFITEDKLTAPDFLAGTPASPKYRAIFIPGVTHISEPACQSLRRFAEDRGHLLAAMGEGCLSRDDYDVPRLTALPPTALVLDASLSSQDLRARLEVVGAAFSIGHSVRLIDTKTEAEPWGVEWRFAHLNGKSLINMVNYTHEVKQVRLEGIEGKTTDLISGKPIHGTVELQPLMPVLLEY